MKSLICSLDHRAEVKEKALLDLFMDFSTKQLSQDFILRARLKIQETTNVYNFSRKL